MNKTSWIRGSADKPHHWTRQHCNLHLHSIPKLGLTLWRFYPNLQVWAAKLPGLKDSESYCFMMHTKQAPTSTGVLDKSCTIAQNKWSFSLLSWGVSWAWSHWDTEILSIQRRCFPCVQQFHTSIVSEIKATVFHFTEASRTKAVTWSKACDVFRYGSDKNCQSGRNQ